MVKYLICEINGRQYKFEPDKPLLIDLIKGEDLKAPVLFKVEDKKASVGKPFLNEMAVLRVLDEAQGEKIRVAKYHAKSNDRKVKGSRAKFSRVVLTS